LTDIVGVKPNSVRHARHHDLDASALCVEVTESVASEPMKVRTVLHALRAAGVRLAIDDFGTGWSSLARLAQLPWDLLKIDRGFISGLGSWGHAETVVGSAIELAHAMGIAALAEGVETVQQASIVRDLGCDYAQGFLYSRPLTRHAATAWVDATSGRHGDVVGARSA
jgi:diguanylate cyclase